MLNKKYSPFLYLAFFYVAINVFLRFILFFHPITEAQFSFAEVIKIFLLGGLSDFFIFTLASSFLWFYLLFLSNSKYLEPYGYIILAGLVGLLLYLKLGNTILNEYGGSLPEVVITFISIKTFFFGLLLFAPKYRKEIRFWLFCFVIFLYSLLIIQNCISEYFFWNEFGVRYNFIAVDYLIYTNEVIGNIMESYPVIPIFIGLFLVSGFITYLIVKNTKVYLEVPPHKTS